jgi:hypothetical protein
MTRSRLASGFLSVCLFSVMPLSAEAKVRTLWPLDFRAVGLTAVQTMDAVGAVAVQSSVWLSSGGGTVTFDSPVRLPVGARITGLTVGGRKSVAGMVRVQLYRRPMAPTTIEEVAVLELADNSPVDSYSTSDVLLPAVQSGYYYFARCTISGAMNAVYGVKVRYR